MSLATIMKTAAVHPHYRGYGLSSWLVYCAEKLAHQHGYSRAIHALMYEQNTSFSISLKHDMQVMRRYALFAKDL